jgi:DNA invertase Pin-like site-specific DNA recombinase
MSGKRRIGISYGRFSDPKQAGGDSEDRQDRMYRDFCQRHNLTPLTEVFLDRGRSGYRDEHRKKGRLGVLIQYAKDGRFEPGSVIVVEAWDRLGRLRPDKQTDLVAELLRTGVDIGVCRLNDTFTEADFGTHKWIILSTFIMLAYQESKQKGERVAASWQSKRQAARERGELLTSKVPAWLAVVNGKPVPVPERVAAVHRIFQLSANGYGMARVIRTLVAEKVPTFGGPRWTIPYLNKILNDRRVLGEYQPCVRDGRKHVPDGPVLKDYFPRVVSDEEYNLARAGQEGRRGKGGKRDRKHVNVFQSLLTHARDGEGFFLHNHGHGVARDGGPNLVLVNSAGMAGRAQLYTFPYPVFEEAVLGLLREVDPKDVLPRSQESPGKADMLRARLANVRADLAALHAELKAGFSKTLAAVVRDREAEEEVVAGQLQEELARSARPAERAWKDMPGLADLVKRGGDEARLKLRPVLRRVVENAVVLVVPRRSWRLCAVEVFFDGGARRDYLIVHQTAGRCRPGGWWARSLADAAGPAAFDLREPTAAARLEAWLSGVDVGELRRLLGG